MPSDWEDNKMNDKLVTIARFANYIEAELAREYYKDCVQNLKWALGIIIGFVLVFIGYAIFKSRREYRDALADVKEALRDAREACREARAASDKAREYEEKARETEHDVYKSHDQSIDKRAVLSEITCYSAHKDADND